MVWTGRLSYSKIGPDLLLAFGSSAIENLSGVQSHYCKIHIKAFLSRSIADFLLEAIRTNGLTHLLGSTTFWLSSDGFREARVDSDFLHFTPLLWDLIISSCFVRSFELLIYWSCQSDRLLHLAAMWAPCARRSRLQNCSMLPHYRAFYWSLYLHHVQVEPYSPFLHVCDFICSAMFTMDASTFAVNTYQQIKY